MMKNRGIWSTVLFDAVFDWPPTDELVQVLYLFKEAGVTFRPEYPIPSSFWDRYPTSSAVAMLQSIKANHAPQVAPLLVYPDTRGWKQFCDHRGSIDFNKLLIS